MSHERLDNTNNLQLDDEEVSMQREILDLFKISGRKYIDEMREWRDNHPEASYGEAIRALYKTRKRKPK